MIAADIERMHHRPDLYPQPRAFRKLERSGRRAAAGVQVGPVVHPLDVAGASSPRRGSRQGESRAPTWRRVTGTAAACAASPAPPPTRSGACPHPHARALAPGQRPAGGRARRSASQAERRRRRCPARHDQDVQRGISSSSGHRPLHRRPESVQAVPAPSGPGAAARRFAHLLPRDRRDLGVDRVDRGRAPPAAHDDRRGELARRAPASRASASKTIQRRARARPVRAGDAKTRRGRHVARRPSVRSTERHAAGHRHRDAALGGGHDPLLVSPEGPRHGTPPSSWRRKRGVDRHRPAPAIASWPNIASWGQSESPSPNSRAPSRSVRTPPAESSGSRSAAPEAGQREVHHVALRRQPSLTKLCGTNQRSSPRSRPPAQGTDSQSPARVPTLIRRKRTSVLLRHQYASRQLTDRYARRA